MLLVDLMRGFENGLMAMKIGKPKDIIFILFRTGFLLAGKLEIVLSESDQPGKDGNQSTQKEKY